MIQGVIEVAVDMMVVTKLLDDVETYEVVAVAEPVNVFDTICRYTYLAEASNVDDESILYKTLVIIKQDVINFWKQLGCENAETKWLSLMSNLTRLIRDSVVKKLNAQIKALNPQLTYMRNNINGTNEEICDQWNEFVRVKNVRNDLIRKKKKLMALQ